MGGCDTNIAAWGPHLGSLEAGGAGVQLLHSAGPAAALEVHPHLCSCGCAAQIAGHSGDLQGIFGKGVSLKDCGSRWPSAG